MKILIIGLGLIGASYAKGLSQKGHIVYGVDRDEKTLILAKKDKIVKDASSDFRDFIDQVDMILIALYPTMVIEVIREVQPYLKTGQLITDVAGVKSAICEEARSLAAPATFIGHHPMAGREKVGIEYSDESIFKGANFLICSFGDEQEEQLNKLKEVACALGFKNVRIISPDYHDAMIAYTSQLTHAIAVSLVNANNSEDIFSFVGDSYRDLTRIADINTKLWEELFFLNKEHLLYEIVKFEDALDTIKKALLTDDKELLEKEFNRAGVKRRKL